MPRSALRVVDLPVEKLEPYARNSRTHTPAQVAQLARSIEQFGWTVPILIGKDRVVIAGHARLAAAKLLGRTHVPTIALEHLTEQQAKAYVVADNRLAELAGWDEETLSRELAELQTSGFDLDVVGFSDADLAELMREKPHEPAEPEPEQESEEPEPEAIEKPVTQPGEVWTVGQHRVACGDSLEAAHRARLLGGVRADLALCDPPFAIYGSSTGVASDVADDKMVRPFFEALARALQASVKQFGHVYVCTDWRSWASLWEGCKSAKLAPRNLLVWDKGGASLGNNYANTYELVGFFANLPRRATMTSSNHTGQRPVLQSNIIRVSRVNGADRLHNAQKPVALLAQLVENSTDRGETVVDLFGGSGSVLAACEQTGRKSFTSELEPRWVDVILRRAERLTGVPARLEGDGRTLAEIQAERG